MSWKVLYTSLLLKITWLDLIHKEHPAIEEAWKHEHHNLSHALAKELRPGAGRNSYPSLGF